MDRIFRSKTEIIFDFDRTILTAHIDWQEWHRGIGTILRSYEPGFSLDIQEGKVAYAIQNEFIKKYGRELADKLTAFVANYEASKIKGYEENPAAINIVRKLSGQNLYIWSSNSRHTVYRGLEAAGILPLFKKIISRESVLCTKPDTEGFSLIRDPAVPPDRYLFVGDSRADRTAAAAAGIEYLDVAEITGREAWG